MTEQRTIFLATDGRYVTLGRGHIPVPDDALEDIMHQRLDGWVVFVTGSIRAKYPRLEWSVPFNGATDAQWPAAVAAFYKGRVP